MESQAGTVYHVTINLFCTGKFEAVETSCSNSETKGKKRNKTDLDTIHNFFSFMILDRFSKSINQIMDKIGNYFMCVFVCIYIYIYIYIYTYKYEKCKVFKR